MLTTEMARKFADEWISAWNSHDLEKILAHYDDNFSMSSPVIRQLTDEASGTLTGKVAIAKYWAKALAKNPQLRFTLREVLTGVDSVTILYDGVRGSSAEVFIFAASGKVINAMAHYVTAVK